MKRVLLILGLILCFLGVGSLGWWLGQRSCSSKISSPVSIIQPRPLEKYTIENLSQTVFPSGSIKLGDILEENSDFIAYQFSFEFDPDLDGKKLKIVTGQINIPNDGEKKKDFPLVLMLRGYVDQEIYQTGIGTNKAAAVFARNGYLTVAPDFLGYGGSDEQSGDVFEARFQTYTTVLSLLASLDSISEFNGQDVLIWAHSNGGQIALTVLEITGQDYPTTFWAPVTKPFPYSILYYTDEADDRGKYLRKELAHFEDLYDTDLYSIDRYLEKIQAPLQLHQGMADDAVPVEWSDQFVSQMEKLEKEIDYFKYPGADHNLKQSWNTVVSRDLVFLNQHLQEE